MATIGELSDFSVSDLMMIISQRQRTGRLVVKSGGEQVTLYFEGGQLVRVNSGDIALRIGRMLVRQGLLDTPRLLEALHLQSEAGADVPIGEVLLGNGWITEADLSRCLEEQSIEVLCRAMTSGPGVFTFDPDLQVKRSGDITPLDPVALIKIAVERTAALAVLHERLPDHLTPIYLSVPQTAVPDLLRTLDPPEAAIIGVLKSGPRTYPELAIMAALDEMSLGASVLTLLENEIITTSLPQVTGHRPMATAGTA